MACKESESYNGNVSSNIAEATKKSVLQPSKLYTELLRTNDAKSHRREEPNGVTKGVGTNENYFKPRSPSPDTGDKIKSSLLAGWNNFKHGWTVRTDTNFKHGKPLWLLGKQYLLEKLESDNFLSGFLDSNDALKTSHIYQEFLLDFRSRIWLTYRKGFPAICDSNLTSDVGWGCMIRSGQMMLAEALVRHHLSRDWSWQLNPHITDSHILRLFGDVFGQSHPFSIHQLTSLGRDYGKELGDWFGPASIAAVLRDAVDCAIPICPLVKDLRVYVAVDGTVYKQDVVDLCSDVYNTTAFDAVQQQPLSVDSESLSTCLSIDNHNSSKHDATIHIMNPHLFNNIHVSSQHLLTDGHFINQHLPSDSNELNQYLATNSAEFHQSDCALSTVSSPWHSLIILIPVRLGSEELNTMYIDCLRQMLMNPMCLGIIGGKPKHSLYFVGWQDEKLVYLDPHCCQDFVDTDADDFPNHTYHCSHPRKTSFSKMDPTCTIGFYCKQRQDFEDFSQMVSKMASPNSESDNIYSMFVVVEGHSHDSHHIVDFEDLAASPQQQSLNVSSHLSLKPATSKANKKDSEDFVFL